MRHLLVLPFILGPALPALAQPAQTPPQAPGEFSELALDGLDRQDLVDTPLMGASGERIGTIQNVLLLEDDTDKIVVGTGGYGDLSTRKVLLELSDLRIERAEDGSLTATTSLTAAEIDALAAYESA